MSAEEITVALAIGIPSLIVAMLALWVGYLTYRASLSRRNQPGYRQSATLLPYAPNTLRRFERYPKTSWQWNMPGMGYPGDVPRALEGPPHPLQARSSFSPGQQWEHRERHMGFCMSSVHLCPVLVL